MADEEEQQNTPDISEFEAKSTASGNNKDMWLFLIIIDVVLMCVFGFFLYKNLSAKLLFPAPEKKPIAEVEETVVMEESPVLPTPAAEPQEEVVLTEEVKEAAVPTVQEPEKEVVVSEEKALETVKAPEVTKATPTEKKQSVVIQSIPNSKYRQVTFRYFGDAKDVAVVSGFTMTKPRPMVKKDGVWETTLSISPGTYKYLYVVDGKQQPDPYAEQKNGRSIVVVK